MSSPSLEGDQKQEVLKGNASTVEAFALSELVGCLPALKVYASINILNL